jgi:hypothetical protein
MAVENTLLKSFTAFGGLDLRVSDLLRDDNMATEALNAIFRDSGALSKRNGFQVQSRSGGGYGATTFFNKDILTNNITEELISVSNVLNIHTVDSFEVSYAGSGTAYYSLSLNSADSNFYFSIEVDGVSVLNVNVGTGKESSFTSISDLITLINLVTDFSCVNPTNSNEPAAFIPVARNVVIESTGTAIEFRYWSSVDKPYNSTNNFYYTNLAKNNADFEGASFAPAQDCMYIATGHDSLAKYDGNRCYLAGMKTPGTIATAGSSVGALTGAYKWKITYEYKDCKENIIEGKTSPVYTSTLAAEQIDLTIPNLSDTSGYNTDIAYSTAGLGVASATLPVDSGHKIKQGDYVCFINASIGDLETRQVLSVTATTINIDGSSVTLSAGSTITAGLKINLWRTKAGKDTFYLSKELVNIPGSFSQSYVDNKADTALGAEYIDALVTYSEIPPTCRYVSNWRGHMIMSGDPFSINTVYFSEINSPEQWSADYSFTVEDNTGGSINAHASLDNVLFVFKGGSIHSVTGELTTSNFQVDRIPTQGIGCTANKTLVEVDGNLMFLSKNGPYMIAQNGEMVFIGDRISPRFKNSDFNFKQAQSFNWVKKDKILLHMPIIELSTGGDNYSGTLSKIFVFDTYRKAWLEWSNHDIRGGISLANDVLYNTRWELDAVTGTTKYYLCATLENGDEFDYADHNEPIPFQFATNWQAMGEPTIFKKFLRLKIHSLEGSAERFECNQFQINVETEHDYQPIVLSSFTFDFSGGASGWGNSPWGNFPWGEVILTSLKHKLISRKSKSIRVRFKNEESLQNIIISGFEMEVTASYKARIKE